MKEKQGVKKSVLDIDPEDLYENVKNGISSLWKKTVEKVDNLEEQCSKYLNKKKPQQIKNYNVHPNPELLGQNIQLYGEEDGQRQEQGVKRMSFKNDGDFQEVDYNYSQKRVKDDFDEFDCQQNTQQNRKDSKFKS